MSTYVGIDVGGTRLKAGLVDERSGVHGEQVLWLSPQDQTEDGMVQKLVEAVRAVDPSGSAVAVGLGVAGVVRWADGVITESPNFPLWKEFAVRSRLRERLGREVYLDNDANCVIAGEALLGVAAGRKNVIGLTLGTGVGGGLVLDGHLWRGEGGMAGELGHITVDAGGPPCGCGGNGCLETYASLVGLRRMCATRPVSGVDVASADLPRLLSAAAAAGDATALAHFAAAGRALGQVLAGLLNALNVRTVVLAGGVANAFRWMEAATRAEIEHRAFAAVRKDVEIRVGTLGEKAGVIGAALQGGI